MKIKMPINLETQKMVIAGVYRNLAISMTQVFFKYVATTAFLVDKVYQAIYPG